MPKEHVRNLIVEMNEDMQVNIKYLLYDIGLFNEYVKYFYESNRKTIMYNPQMFDFCKMFLLRYCSILNEFTTIEQLIEQYDNQNIGVFGKQKDLFLFGTCGVMQKIQLIWPTIKKSARRKKRDQRRNEQKRKKMEQEQRCLLETKLKEEPEKPLSGNKRRKLEHLKRRELRLREIKYLRSHGLLRVSRAIRAEKREEKYLHENRFEDYVR